MTSARRAANTFVNGMFTGHAELYRDDLEAAFSALVDAEREACAQIAEKFREWARDTAWDEGVEHAKREIAAAIRARGEERT